MLTNLELTREQKQRLKAVSRGLLQNSTALTAIGNRWREREYTLAVEQIGIFPDDFDALYAYLMPSYFPVANMETPPGPDPNVNSLPDDQIQSLENAFKALLEPAKLEEFLSLWKSGNRDQALAAIHLDGAGGGMAGLQNFYKYLANHNIPLDLIMWG